MRQFLIIMIACSQLSCDDKGQHFDHSDVIGNYKVTEWNAPIAVDLDQDGDSSRNLLDESNCFEGAEITLFSDRTFVKTFRSILIDVSSPTCQTDNWVGTWHRTGDRLTLIWETVGGIVSDNYNFGSVNERLTRTIENTYYPNIGENGQLIYEIGHVNVVFSKVNE